jgi:hypothetical protein
MLWTMRVFSAILDSDGRKLQCGAMSCLPRSPHKRLFVPEGLSVYHSPGIHSGVEEQQSGFGALSPREAHSG